MNYSFLQPLSQNFEVLTLYGDVIKPKMGQKDQNWNFMCLCWKKDENQK